MEGELVVMFTIRGRDLLRSSEFGQLRKRTLIRRKAKPVADDDIWGVTKEMSRARLMLGQCPLFVHCRHEKGLVRGEPCPRQRQLWGRLCTTGVEMKLEYGELHHSW